MVDVARLDVMQASTAVSARVVSRERILIPAETQETVRSVRARVGDRVAKGAVLATLETANVSLLVDTLKAQEAYLKSQVELLSQQAVLRQRQLERAQTLNTRDLLTRDATEQAELNLLQVESNRVRTGFDLRNVQLQLADAKRRLALTEIVAKRGGRILGVEVSEGQYVKVGDPLFAILPDGGLELEVEVRPEAFEALKQGQVLQASVRGAPVDVAVRARIAEENPRTGARLVRLEFLSAVDETLVIGERVDLALPVGVQREQVTVAKDAIMPVADGHRVVVVVDGNAEPRRVTLGESASGRIAIVEGVAAGDLVVVQGQDGLRKGQSVRVLESTP